MPREVRVRAHYAVRLVTVAVAHEKHFNHIISQPFTTRQNLVISMFPATHPKRISLHYLASRGIKCQSNGTVLALLFYFASRFLLRLAI